MEILSSYDLVKKGKTTEAKYVTGIMQPIQMLPKEEKDEIWGRRAVDWYESLGIRQLRHKYKNIQKNYHLARGIIDKEDYIKDSSNDYNNILTTLVDTDEEGVNAMSLDFFPIIPNVINILMGEFSKRSVKPNVQAVDQFSKNEKLEAKFEKVKEFATQKARQRLYTELMNSGYQIKSEEELARVEEDLNKKVQSLPEIQELFRKNYRSTIEQWAQHQLNIDYERFDMFEKENSAFYDYLVTDSQFWHIKLKENDYDVELWSPINTFYHKSPEVKYVSEGNYVGRITMMSIPDVIDNFGYKMKEEEVKSLERLYHTAMTPLSHGSQNSDYYDTSRPYTNQEPNSVNLHKLLSGMSNNPMGQDSFLNWLNRGTDSATPFDQGMVRVTQVYWKSQKKLGKLTKINELGEVIREIITEDYMITVDPIYDTSFIKKKNEETLIYGEHVDWFWINEVYGGTKINTLLRTIHTNNSSGVEPIYLDIEPIPFQFKSEENLWGNKLPVEGISCSDVRTNKPVSPVDLMKPYQVKYNIVNNQIKDLLIDEIGSVILLDQNHLPSNSMGEDWGKNNLGKAYVAMKNFQILPLDSSIDNLEGRNSFSHFQVLNMEQTNRFLSRLKIGEWAKLEAFATIGISPERLGDTAPSESATGVNAAMNNSYVQTEKYFTQHINHIMPKVKNMMIEAAQFYQSTKPSVDLQYMTDEGEQIMFQIEGYKLLPRDIQVYTNFRPNTKVILDQMKSLVVENNTSGANIYDLLKIITLDTPSEIIEAAKQSIEQFNAQEQAKRDHEQQMLDKQIEANNKQREEEMKFEAAENEEDRRAKLAEASIKAMGYSNDTDLNKNQVPDLLEIDKFNSSLSQFQDKLLLDKEKMTNDRSKNMQDYILKQKEILRKEKELEVKQRMQEKDLKVKKEISDNTLKVAKENKNKNDRK